MSWSVVTLPSAEPISLEDAKTHLRADDTDDEDTLISAFIQAAREHVERVCERALMPQVWQESRDSFSPMIELRGGVITEVQAVTYLDQDGVSETLDAGAYQVDLAGRPPAIYPAFATQWPQARRQPGAVVVRYSLGYTDAASVPAPLLAAMLLIIGDLYSNRAAQSGAAVYENVTVQRLLMPWMRIRP